MPGKLCRNRKRNNAYWIAWEIHKSEWTRRNWDSPDETFFFSSPRPPVRLPKNNDVNKSTHPEKENVPSTMAIERSRFRRFNVSGKEYGWCTASRTANSELELNSTPTRTIRMICCFNRIAGRKDIGLQRPIEKRERWTNGKIIAKRITKRTTCVPSGTEALCTWISTECQ